MNRVMSSILMVSVSAVVAWAIVSPPGQFDFLGGAVAAPTTASSIQIDRNLKGDRLAPAPTVIKTERKPMSGAENKSAPRRDDAKMMDGCEPAASPIASPELAHIIGSCVS